jgi:hypothetical protein
LNIYIFKILPKLPESVTQMYNKKLNKIKIYQFYIILHICQKQALFRSFSKYCPFWLKFCFLVVFEKLFFQLKFSLKTDKWFRKYDFSKIKNFDEKLKKLSQNLYRKKIPIRSKMFFFRMLKNLNGD